MPPLTFTLPHSLGKDEARRRIDHGFANIQQQLSAGSGFGLISFDQRWEGDRLSFSGRTLGQTIQGRIDILPDSVHLEVDLPVLLAALADKITGRLKQETVKLLEQKK